MAELKNCLKKENRRDLSLVGHHTRVRLDLNYNKKMGGRALGGGEPPHSHGPPRGGWQLPLNCRQERRPTGQLACSRAAVRLDVPPGLGDSSPFPHQGTGQWSLCATSQEGEAAGWCIGQRQNPKGHPGAWQGRPLSERGGGGRDVRKRACRLSVRAHAWGYAVVSAGLLSESLSLR